MGQSLVVWMLGALALVGCYAPTAQPNLPCAQDGSCPQGQTCELTTRICNGTVTGGDARGDSASPSDGPGDDPTDGAGMGPWTVAPLGLPNNSNDEDPTMTSDRLLVVFARRAQGNNFALYTSSRSSSSSAWATPVAISELNQFSQVTSPELSPDGLAMFFTGGPASARDVYYATRADRSAPWSSVLPVIDLSTSSDDVGIGIRPDGLLALVDNSSSGERDLYKAQRQGSGWTALTPAVGLATQGRAEASPTVGSDGSVYFHVQSAQFDIWKGTPVGTAGYTAAPVPELAGYSDPFLLPDGTLMLCAKNGIIYAATR